MRGEARFRLGRHVKELILRCGMIGASSRARITRCFRDGRIRVRMGVKRYRNARDLLITADGGGSNGSRCRLWKVALQALATKLQMPIHVCHFPPGTSKKNKIEHRMFCHITQNWRGRPLVSHEVIIQLIANTRTKAGLRIRAELDSGRYPTGIKIGDEELAALRLKPAKFHGDWNYALLPARKIN